MLQVAASFPGISRSGITMVGGLWRGLSHEDAARFAARFAFLLATPVILAAGVLKLPSHAGSRQSGLRDLARAGNCLAQQDRVVGDEVVTPDETGFAPVHR